MLEQAYRDMEVSCDARPGRSPLFLLPQEFAKLDTGLLLGDAISPEKLHIASWSREFRDRLSGGLSGRGA